MGHYSGPAPIPLPPEGQNAWVAFLLCQRINCDILRHITNGSKCRGVPHVGQEAEVDHVER